MHTSNSAGHSETKQYKQKRLHNLLRLLNRVGKSQNELACSINISLQSRRDARACATTADWQSVSRRTGNTILQTPTFYANTSTSSTAATRGSHAYTHGVNTIKATHMSVCIDLYGHHDSALAFALACAVDLMTTAFINSSTLHRLTLESNRFRLRDSLRSSRLFSERSTASALRFSKSSFNLDAEASSACSNAANVAVVASPTNARMKKKTTVQVML